MNIGLIMNQTILLSGMGIYWFFVLIILLGTVPLIVYLQHRYKRCSMRCETYKQEIAQLKEELLKAKSWEALIPELRNIARLDHDVNTPLCVITMSLGRAKKLGQQSGDELLLNNVKDITDAVARIGEIMQAVRVLKTHPLVVQNKAHTSTKEIGQ